MRTKLKEMMERKGVTQSELSRKSGVDKYRVNAYVNGCAHPGPQTAERFARALGCEPAELQEKGGQP